MRNSRQCMVKHSTSYPGWNNWRLESKLENKSKELLFFLRVSLYLELVELISRQQWILNSLQRTGSFRLRSISKIASFCVSTLASWVAGVEERKAMGWIVAFVPSLPMSSQQVRILKTPSTLFINVSPLVRQQNSLLRFPTSWNSYVKFKNPFWTLVINNCK